MSGDPFDLFRAEPEYRRRVEEDIARRVRDQLLAAQLRLFLGTPPPPPRPRAATQRANPFPNAIDAEFSEQSKAPTPLLPAQVGDEGDAEV